MRGLADTLSVGERIAWYRQRYGMSQEVLAGLVGGCPRVQRVEPPFGPLLVADWAPHPDEGDKLLLVFDGGTLTAEQLDRIRLQADELASYAFRDPAEAVTLLPRLGRRVAAAIDAHQAGRTTYLERGVPHDR